jgi:hypothetical protein
MNIVDSGFMFNDAIKTLMAVKSEYFFFKSMYKFIMISSPSLCNV